MCHVWKKPRDAPPSISRFHVNMGPMLDILVLLLALRGREVLTPEELRIISAVAATCGRKNACLSDDPCSLMTERQCWYCAVRVTTDQVLQWAAT